MKFIYYILLVIFNLFYLNKAKVLALDTITYDSLYNLEINSEIPAWLSAEKSLNKITKSDLTIYTLESTDYSHPHIFYVNADNKLVFMQLTIPAENIKNTNIYLQQLGQPAISTYQSKAETLYGYPELGISFIFNQYSNSAVRVQKYIPEQKDEYMENYGSNYSPSKDDEVKNDIVDMLRNNPFIIYVSAIGILIIALTVVFRKRYD